MPTLETLEKLLSLGDRYGWPWLLVIGGLGSAAFVARWGGRGIGTACRELLPEVKAILVSHRDLMVTANDQIPKQTAILEGLSAGHQESRAILVSIDSHVRTLIPTPSPVSGEPCSTRS